MLLGYKPYALTWIHTRDQNNVCRGHQNEGIAPQDSTQPGQGKLWEVHDIITSVLNYCIGY